VNKEHFISIRIFVKIIFPFPLIFVIDIGKIFGNLKKGLKGLIKKWWF
jgi:hypothetical protein